MLGKDALLICRGKTKNSNSKTKQNGCSRCVRK
jgi:hypothetical protein